MATVGLAYRGEALLHDTGRWHPECPDRLRAIVGAFREAGVSEDWLEVAPAARADLERVHTAEHVRYVRGAAHGRVRHHDPETPIRPDSWEAASLAAGAAIAAAAAVVNGDCDRAFSIMRPPGHHAEADLAMGFCLFNNVAVAARWLQAEAGLRRVAIFDWDVHHGNGTQNSFYDDDTVFYASIHQSPLFPGTGREHERGRNSTNLNVEMPPDCDPDLWLDALDARVAPALEDFDPDFLLISAGFDAHRLDPLANQRLEAWHFAEMTRRVKGIAGGRVASTLEGGYDLDALAACALAHYEALAED